MLPASHSAQMQSMSFATLHTGFGPSPLSQNQLPVAQGQVDILMLDHGVERAGPEVKGSHLVSLQSSAMPVISGMPADGFLLSKMAPETGPSSNAVSASGLQFSDALLAGKMLLPKKTSSMDQKSSFAMQDTSTISSSNSQSVSASKE